MSCQAEERGRELTSMWVETGCPTLHSLCSQITNFTMTPAEDEDLASEETDSEVHNLH